MKARIPVSGQGGSKEHAVDKLRMMVRWLNNSNEGACQQVDSIADLERLYDIFRACDWDVTLDEFPDEAWAAALDAESGQAHANAVRELNAWMEHREYHVPSAPTNGCQHCVGWPR